MFTTSQHLSRLILATYRLILCCLTRSGITRTVRALSAVGFHLSSPLWERLPFYEEYCYNSARTDLFAFFRMLSSLSILCTVRVRFSDDDNSVASKTRLVG
jgi:hypothetical protein